MDLSQVFSAVVPFAESMPALRAILAAVIVFVMPGFAWTLAIFPQVNIIERAALSLGLSVAGVTLGVLALHLLFGMRINGNNALLYIIALTLVGLALYLVRRLRERRAKAMEGD